MTNPPMGRRVNRVDELRRDIPPTHDLWPAISAAIEADKAAASPVASRRRSAWLPAAGMAAALGLVAIGVLIGRITPPAVIPPIVQTPASASPEMMPAAYLKQRDSLFAEVQAKLSAMPEIERKKVAASLATLRSSIEEIEKALGHDPANALLQELFVNSCQEEMRALTAVRDSGGQET